MGLGGGFRLEKRPEQGSHSSHLCIRRACLSLSWRGKHLSEQGAQAVLPASRGWAGGSGPGRKGRAVASTHSQGAPHTHLWTEKKTGRGRPLPDPRSQVWGEPLGPRLKRDLGKEARLGQNGLLKHPHHHGRLLAQVAKQQPSQSARGPDQLWVRGSSTMSAQC